MASNGLRRFEAIRERHIAATRAYVDEAVDRLGWSRERVVRWQTECLRALVARAVAGSAYYRERLGGVDVAKLDARDLSSLPILTKGDVMANWDQIVTDSRLRIDEVTQHLEDLHQGRKDNAYYLDEYLIAATGGTSGTRGVFVWDWQMALVNPAGHYRWEAQADRENPPSGPRRTAVICASSFVHASRFVFPVMVDPERESRVFPAGMPIAEMVEALNEYQPDRIVGFASIVEELAEYAIEGALRVAPNRVSTNSEPFDEHGRKLVRDAWGLETHGTWGSVEIGVAAVEGPSFGGLSLAEDLAIFEVVDEYDQPVDDPADANRVLVTRLYGSTMPLIRYEMTDTLILDEGPNPDAIGCRRVVRIEGRADVWFVYGDTKIHPMVFRDILGQRHEISEYQVQQTKTGARVLAILHGQLDLREVEVSLESSLRNAGLLHPEVAVESATALPRHPETNKLKRFVPL
ncbi:MAG: hypothetical protein AAF997_08175 [Myxococcota bacterium]